MRIISKYKDYYDGVQSLGHDSSMIYFRKTETVDTPTENKIDTFLLEHANYDNVQKIRHRNSNKSTLYLSKVIIGFCGQLITSYCTQWSTEDKFESPIFFYSKEELVKYLTIHDKVWSMEDLTYRRIKYWTKKIGINWQDCIPDFEPITGNYDQIFHALKKPIFIFPSFVFEYEFIMKNLYSNKINWKKNKIIVDPELKQIGFQRIKDAFQCYQSIEQYISGVLGNTEKNTDDRSDVEKVRSHGFDEKYGFRTRKKE